MDHVPDEVLFVVSPKLELFCGISDGDLTWFAEAITATLADFAPDPSRRAGRLNVTILATEVSRESYRSAGHGFDDAWRTWAVSLNQPILLTVLSPTQCCDDEERSLVYARLPGQTPMASIQVTILGKSWQQAANAEHPKDWWKQVLLHGIPQLERNSIPRTVSSLPSEALHEALPLLVGENRPGLMIQRAGLTTPNGTKVVFM